MPQQSLETLYQPRVVVTRDLGAGERSEVGAPKWRVANTPLPGAVRMPDPEVRPPRRRKHHTAGYKLAILAETDQAAEGQIGAILRREGLHSSHLSNWREARRLGTLAALTPKRRGPAPVETNPLVAENARLKHEIAKLAAQLEKAKLIIDVQKKLDRKRHSIGGQAGKQVDVLLARAKFGVRRSLP